MCFNTKFMVIGIDKKQKGKGLVVAHGTIKLAQTSYSLETNKTTFESGARIHNKPPTSRAPNVLCLSTHHV